MLIAAGLGVGFVPRLLNWNDYGSGIETLLLSASIQHSLRLCDCKTSRNFFAFGGDDIDRQYAVWIELLTQEKRNPELMERTFYYLDPPYIYNKVSYKINRIDEKFHKTLTEVMAGIPYIMISGYDNEIYEENLVKKLGFHKYVLCHKYDYISQCKEGTRAPRTEVIWTSYPV